jgi:parallel beta-helix repeat protein
VFVFRRRTSAFVVLAVVVTAVSSATGAAAPQPRSAPTTIRVVTRISPDRLAPATTIGGVTSGDVVKGTLAVSASATDNVGVKNVDLLVDGAVVASDRTAPYAWSWSSASVPDGPHSLQARAFDGAANVGVSAAVVVTVANNVPPADTQAPSVMLGAPVGGATLSGPISVWATAADNVGVAQVDLLVDGVVVASDGTSPYSWGWSSSSVADGSHTLQARAYDAAGNAGSSAAVTVTVANPVAAPDTKAPSIGVTAPTAGAAVSGSVTVTADASDDVGVAKVDLFVDGTLVGSDAAPPYAWAWQSDSVDDGAHALQARASDRAGNVGSSAVVSVTVANAKAAPPAPACTGVSVSPGQALQSTVNAYGTGTTFCLKAGIHRLSTGVVPKSGDQFIGEPGAVVSGAKDITALFTASNGFWVASGQTQRNQATTGFCETASPLCTSSDDVFLDDKLLRRVASASELGPGRFFFDYAAQKIWIGDNPSGRRVEAAVATRAFAGAAAGATNVTVRGLVVEKCANEAGAGAITANSGWTIESNEVRLNHGIGIQGGVTVRNNNVHHNGQLGMSQYGASDVLVEGNEIAFNDSAGYDPFWEAGGAKFMRTTRLTVRDNHVHDNRGIGLWSDTDNVATTYSGNRIDDNTGAGILIETGFQTLISNNTIRRNGFAFAGGLTGSGIYLNTSQDVEIVGNTLDRNRNGVGIASFDRGSGPYGAYVTRNDYVHDNTIILAADGGHGLASPYVADYTSNNNRFENNRYTLCGPAYFAVSNGAGAYRYTNQQGWLTAGYDRTASFATGC